ncbi:MAG: hypothetical protein JEZ09_11005 [Salinivirgaceae bacterium]|nr:hypothetical protein [Salinivirgaceae bacterium]
MKSTLLKTTFSVLFVTIFTSGVMSQGLLPYQNPKYGVDSASRIACAMNISLYSEFYKQNNYKDALGPWRKVYNNCPDASKNTFIKGANIYKNLIAREKNAVNKEAYIDTLMMIYDKRIEVFGGKGNVLSYKGSDLYSYRGDKVAKEVYTIIKEAMSLEKGESAAGLITIYMQTAVSLYSKKEIDGVEVIGAYTFAMETIDLATTFNKNRVAKGGKYAERAQKELENIETSASNVEALFSESGAATCEALVNIFGAKYNENAQDIEWLKKVTKLLNKSECTDVPLFAKASEQQYKLEPSAEAAHNLARLFLKNEEYAKANGYYIEATKLQEDALTNALYYFEWSTLAMAQGSYEKVRSLSIKALQLNANDGRPYLMIGKAYAADSKNIGKEQVEHNAVYWVAVDKFYKAKAVDASLTEQANELIKTYSQYFPNKEEAFMFGIEDGASYTVGGWINETTKARF